MKECSRCHKVLEDSCFYKNTRNKDGLQTMCKDCQKEYNKIRKGGGMKSKSYTNPDLAQFTPRQLIAELKARGYTGELKYVQVINLNSF